MQFRYPDNSTGPARQFVYGSDVIPSSYLTQRSGETEVVWLVRLDNVEVMPVRTEDPGVDINEYDLGDPVVTETAGWLVISYPSPVAKTPVWSTATRERMFVSAGADVPDGYTTLEPEDRWSIWTGTAWEQDPAAIDAVRGMKMIEIRDRANLLLSNVGAEYGDMERTTWDVQAAEAAAFAADPEAAVPLLAGIAAQRGMTVADMAVRVLSNRAAWVALSGSIVGQRLALQDRLDVAVSIEEIEEIEVEYVFPV